MCNSSHIATIFNISNPFIITGPIYDCFCDPIILVGLENSIVLHNVMRMFKYGNSWLYLLKPKLTACQRFALSFKEKWQKSCQLFL